MAKELKKLGAGVEELEDGVIIDGRAAVCGDFRGYGDHRIVMAMALVAMACQGQSRIDTAEAMNVTFPKFMGYMQSLGADMEIYQ